MATRCKVLIIGAGVNGLGTAYELAQAGIDDVVILEKRYPMYGGSGRNGGGVRAQWASMANLELARRSIHRWNGVASDLGLHTWFRQDGYLMLACTQELRQALRERATYQRSLGIPTSVIPIAEAQELAPCADLDGYVGATYCPEDAVIFPWPVVNGLREAVEAAGLELVTGTPVTGFTTETQAGQERITEVQAPGQTYRPEIVVNTAGPWSANVARMAGVDLPNMPVRHQIFVTEAIKPVLDPMVVDLHTGLYVSQDGRGELVAGLGDRQEREQVTTSVSADFLPRISRELVELFPSFSGLHAMRQWAGCYDVTPDHVPNLGPHPKLPNFLQANGFSGHGFMISPEVTRVLGKLILGQDPGIDLAPYRVDRFEAGTAQPEPMVIG